MRSAIAKDELSSCYHVYAGPMCTFFLPVARHPVVADGKVSCVAAPVSYQRGTAELTSYTIAIIFVVPAVCTEAGDQQCCSRA